MEDRIKKSIRILEKIDNEEIDYAIETLQDLWTFMYGNDLVKDCVISHYYKKEKVYYVIGGLTTNKKDKATLFSECEATLKKEILNSELFDDWEVEKVSI